MLILLLIPSRVIIKPPLGGLKTTIIKEIPHMKRGMCHLDLVDRLIKEKVEAKEIKLFKVASADNTSDLGTKRLALPLFNKLSSRIIDKALLVNF